MMKTLIVGARGYVGLHVTLELLTQGHEVHALVRDGESPPLGTQAVAVSIAERERLGELATQYDAVGYFAASNEPAFAAISDAAVKAIVSCMSSGQRFAMQGGSMVFGDSGSSLQDETLGFHPAPALATRASFEADVLRSGRVDGPACSIIYGSLVHGGRGAMIPGLLRQAAVSHGSLVLPPKPNLLWSTVHIQDWARLIVDTLCGGPAEGGAWLAAGPLLALDELISAAAQLSKVALPVHAEPEDLVRHYGFFGHALMMNQCFHANKAKAAYSWRAQKNNWRDSLNELYAQAR